MVITILHTADNHLDPKLSSGLKRGFARKYDFMDSFSRLVDYALENKPDLLLICGDFFDSTDPLNLARMKAIKKLKKIYDNGTHIFMISGQHDTTSSVREGSSPIHELMATEFVTFFGQIDKISYKILNIKGIDVCISGISFNRSLSPSEDPLEEFDVPCEGDLNILMLHYGIEGFPVFKESEPFVKLKNLPSNLHYVAGGHIHKKTHKKIQNTLICYPGSTEKKNVREVAHENGFYWLEYEDGGFSDPKFVPLQTREMKVVKLNLTELIKSFDLEESIKKNKDVNKDNILTFLINQVINEEGEKNLILEIALTGSVDTGLLKTFRIDEIKRHGFQKCFDFDIKFNKDDISITSSQAPPPPPIEAPIEAFVNYLDHLIGTSNDNEKKFYIDVRNYGLKFLKGEKD